MEKVSLVGVAKVVSQATAVDVGIMVAGFNGTVTQGTGLFVIGRKVLGTAFTRFLALFKIGADDRRIEPAAEAGVLILWKGACNRCFRESFFDAILDGFSVF